jgi:ribonuclease HII
MYDLPIAKLVAGVDEAGRGPLAGSVIAAAVILIQPHSIIGLTDSKKLSSVKRGALEEQIKKNSVAWAIGESSCTEIDEMNILQASLLAMKRAILQLNPMPVQALIDGNRVPDIPGLAMQAMIKGDLYEPCISAASILAKEYRDRQMVKLDQQYPQYRFAQHKGYPTRLHRSLLKQFGASPVHRVSFKPVREVT